MHAYDRSLSTDGDAYFDATSVTFHGLFLFPPRPAFSIKRPRIRYHGNCLWVNRCLMHACKPSGERYKLDTIMMNVADHIGHL
jgi:hypothetical protein